MTSAQLDHINSLENLLGSPPPNLSGQALANWKYLTPHYFRSIETIRTQGNLAGSLKSNQKLNALGGACRGIFTYHTKYGCDPEIHELALRVARAVQARLISRSHERDRERAARLVKGLETKRQKQKERNAKQVQCQRRYYETHREQERARSRAYRVAHQDELRARSRAYRVAHQDELRARNRAYREAHREEFAEKARDYRARKKALAVAGLNGAGASNQKEEPGQVS